MKVYLKGRKSGVDARAEFDPISKKMTVLKGSILSDSIANSVKFRGAKSIAKTREGVLKGRVLQTDVPFTSASTAANFVTGRSANGLIEWKDEGGRTIKEIIAEVEV